MIITRTPYRISFFGGGTDYPAWYRRHGGAVLGVTIDKYCFISCRYLPPFFDHSYRVVYSKIELCQDITQIEHPAVREVLRYAGIDGGLEIHYDGDLPARSGIGSSSSFTVGLLNAVYALMRRHMSKRELARESTLIEQDILKETVGSQDQYFAAYGGLNHIKFDPSGEITVQPMVLPSERVQELNAHLMLFYTRIARTASDVAKTYVENIEAKERQLRAIGGMVSEGMGILSSDRDISDFGRLLHEAWQAKSSLSAEVSNFAIDEVYTASRAAGAIGGKLLGAGGGGFILLFAHPSAQPAIRRRLAKLVHVPFQFDYTGSQVIFFDPQASGDWSPRVNGAQHKAGLSQEVPGGSVS